MHKTRVAVTALIIIKNILRYEAAKPTTLHNAIFKTVQQSHFVTSTRKIEIVPASTNYRSIDPANRPNNLDLNLNCGSRIPIVFSNNITGQ